MVTMHNGDCHAIAHVLDRFMLLLLVDSDSGDNAYSSYFKNTCDYFVVLVYVYFLHTIWFTCVNMCVNKILFNESCG